jgi:phosphoribosylglycinamide formyltransferase-1
VLIDDTADTLAVRVLTVEHQTYAAALKLVAGGQVKMRADGSVERLSSQTNAEARLISA